jgi:hypothetical protein
MTITPGNLSMLLAIASSIAPGTWAVVAGVSGILVGFLGKQLFNKYDNSTNPSDSSVPRKVSRGSASSGTPNPRKRKKSPPSSGH